MIPELGRYMAQDGGQEVQKTVRSNVAVPAEMPDRGQQDVNGGLYTGTIGLRPVPKSHDIPSQPTEEFDAPFKVTEACSGNFSPFYDVAVGEARAIGIEDKRLGHPETLDEREAPVLVAKYFASDGRKIRESIVQAGGKEGEDRFVVAKKILKLKPKELNDFIEAAVRSNSPYSRQIVSVFIELGIVLNAYMRRLNAQILEPADKYRQGVYKALKLIDAQGSFRTRGRSSDNGLEENVTIPKKYEKQKVDDVLSKLGLREKADWEFLRDLVFGLSHPEVRKRADLLSRAYR